ncbi:MAG: MarR family transcriptional regulator [Dehalococcoidia bacterium]|nr:MarR family transcriptional regulator [Dehalococcoidia bacterium]
MKGKLEGKSQNLKAFMFLHRTRDLLFRCQDRVVAESGLTAEQYSVLVAIAFLDAPVRATDIGRWMDRKVNSVSMIVDRMVKAGLVRRARDLPDRREVRLAMTSKGEQALKSANPPVARLVEEVFSSLSRDQTETLIRLLETLRGRALQHCYPEVNTEDLLSYETEDMDRFLKRMSRYTPGGEPPVKRRRSARRRE